MKKVFLLTSLVAAMLLGPAPLYAQENSAQGDDAIGNLIRDIKSKEQQSDSSIIVARAQTPADDSNKSSSGSSLGKTYENMARCVIRAALITRRDLFEQPRRNIEEFLRAVLTQASFETGRFQSTLATQACNYWGMKDRNDVGAANIFYKGENYEKFPSMYEGCLGYLRVICRERYAGFPQHLSNKEDYLKHLATSGWCPDSDYTEQAMSVYQMDQSMIDRAVQIATNEVYKPSAN